jgi:uncharacterized protein YjgD (DUF1641 family)
METGSVDTVAVAEASDRVERLNRLADRLTEAGTFEALERLLDRLAGAESALGKLRGMLAMLGDIADEWAADVVSQGIEIDTSVKQGVHAALWLGQRVSETELERLGILLRSDVLDPHALAAVGKAGRALAACHEAACSCEVPERLGPMGLMKALGDPDVQRALAFAVRVAKEFGRQLPPAKYGA